MHNQRLAAPKMVKMMWQEYWSYQMSECVMTVGTGKMNTKSGAAGHPCTWREAGGSEFQGHPKLAPKTRKRRK